MGRYVTFNRLGYVNALKRALDKAMDKVSREIYSSIVAEFGTLTFRELDANYIGAMRASIRYARKKTIDTIVSNFLAGGESQPNQSFRVIYYEYGTGSKMEPPSWYTPSTDPYWNPARPQNIGEVIWQRPASSWKDLGGNWHTSYTKGEPRPLSMKSPLARHIEAKHWFKNGFWKGTRNLDKYVLDAVKSVSITTYISIVNIYKRM